MSPAARRGIDITHHCVERFHERSRPALELIRAREELEMLVGVGEVAEQPPAWFAAGAASEADAYLLIGEDLVIPLASRSDGSGMVAKTCITRGVPSEATRARWNARKRKRRLDRAARRRRGGRNK